MPISVVLREALLKHAFKTTQMNQPTNVTVALSTTNPGADGTGITEPSGVAGYARVNHNVWVLNGAGNIENSGTISFPTSTGSWGTISHYAIFADGVFWASNNLRDSGGNITTKTIGIDENMSFPSGAIDITATTS